MDIQVHRAGYDDVKGMRERYRQEANCQLVHDSFLARGLADPYLILVNGRVSGYAGIGNKYPKDQLTEFYIQPQMHSHALPIFRAVLEASQVSYIEAQTNLPLLLLMLYDCAKNITAGPVLFAHGPTTHLRCPESIFRQTKPEDADRMFKHQHEPAGDWLLEVSGEIVATGGFLTHYNPPYADLYMEVAEPARRKGFGSYLVQELKRVCYEAGKTPAARCNSANIASRRTLEKAGMLPCGRLLVGEVDPALVGE